MLANNVGLDALTEERLQIRIGCNRRDAGEFAFGQIAQPRTEAEARAGRRARDVLIASIHWGGNWGCEIGKAERDFARGLIDSGFDIVHGHSSHPKAIEIYRERPILYGCGDFLNDYEGISGYEEFRGDLSLMYLPRLHPATGRLIDLHLVPFKVARFRLQRASPADAVWLRHRLDWVCQPFRVATSLNPDRTLSIHRR